MKHTALFMAALIALGTTACTEDEGSDGEGEPESTATAAESAEGSAEEGSAEEDSAEESADEDTAGKDRLVGTWVLDEETVKEMMEKNEGEADSKQKAAEGMGMALIMAMAPTMEFKDDGTYEFTMQNPMKKDAEPKTETGTWEVTGEDGDTLTVKTKSDEKEEEEQVNATFDGEDKLTFAKEGEETKMYLERQS